MCYSVTVRVIADMPTWSPTTTAGWCSSQWTVWWGLTTSTPTTVTGTGNRTHTSPPRSVLLTAGASSVKYQPKQSYQPWNEAINHIISLAFVLYLYTWYLSELLVYNVKGKPVKYCKTDIFCKWFLAACYGQKKFNPPSRLSLLYKGKGAFRIRFLKFYWSWGFQVWKLAKYSDKLSKYENRF